MGGGYHMNNQIPLSNQEILEQFEGASEVSDNVIGSINDQQINEELSVCETDATQVETGQGMAFPVDVLPYALQRIVAETHQHLTFPVDYIAASLLCAASMSIGNTYRVQFKEGWQENAVLYMALVGRPGINKSHPLNFALAPIREQDGQTLAHYVRERDEYRRLLATTQSERDQVAINEEPPIIPVPRKVLMGDFTPEALASVHDENPRGLGVHCDELAAWFKNFNRYKAGSDMEFWLSSWSGAPISIDRKLSGSLLIPKPFITVVGTMQDGVLHELAKDRRDQNGFVDRILFVKPVGLRKEYWSDTDLNPQITALWFQILTRLLDVPLMVDDNGCPCPRILPYTREAREFLFNWQRSNADHCNVTKNDSVRGIYSKIEVYVHRLALILQLLQWACEEGNNAEVGLTAVQGAADLAEYFRESAIRSYSIIAPVCPVDRLTLDKKRLYDALPKEFATPQGLEIAERMGVPERTFQRFLTDTELFDHICRGSFKKKF